MTLRSLRLIKDLVSPLREQFRGVRNALRERERSGMGAMLERLRGHCPGVSTVVDIGASDGVWSLKCHESFAGASYLAIDALEERRPGLERVSQRLPKFHFEICIAGGTDGGVADIDVSEDLDGSTVSSEASSRTRRCPVRTIDALVAERGLGGPYLLKFDTHGFELPILDGCLAVLPQTEAIVMEVYNFQLTPSSLRFHQMCAHLETLGFRPVDFADAMRRERDSAFWQFDLAFLRADHPVFRTNSFR